MSVYGGMSMDDALGGGMMTKIDATGSAGFSGSFMSASADPSLATQDPLMTAESTFKGLVVG